MSNVQDRTITIGNYVFDEKAHLHTLDGRPLTGVTTVLSVIAKPALIQWAANMACDFIQNVLDKGCEELKDAGNSAFGLLSVKIAKSIPVARTAHKKKKESAGTHGTEVHAEIETYIDTCIEDNNGYALEWTAGYYSERVQKFINWSFENKVKFLASEKHIYSKEWWTGGIVDLIIEIDGKRYIGDVKTSSGIYKTSFFQTAAYAKMAIEMELYPKFDGAVIINLTKTGGFEVQYNYDMEGNTKAFEAALTLYRQMKAIDPNF